MVGLFVRYLAAMLKELPLHLAGWKFEGEKPTVKKCVILAWPHTSNWDGVLLLLATHSIGLKMSWMIKNDWVRGPVGVVLKRLGAVAVDRSARHNLVGQMVEAFNTRDELVLVIPPGGTRKRMETWKSGFYHIARGANVPVVPGYLDFRRKRAGLGPAIYLTGDVKADMDAIRAFYDKVNAQGLSPELVGPIVLRSEAPPPL